MSFKTIALSGLLAFSMNIKAESEANLLDEFDPSATDAMEQVESMSELYDDLAPQMNLMEMLQSSSGANCVERGCPLFIDVDKSKQRAELYIDGTLAHTWKVSTARPGKVTRNHNGIIAAAQFRIFTAKSSNIYKPAPGTTYVENGKDLGNMPYAVFYHGPYAIHGTTAIKNLGTPASAGCVRLHPDHAKTLNLAVRKVGRPNFWVTIN